MTSKVSMMVFTADKRVIYNQQPQKVKYVFLRKGRLYVQLENVYGLVNSDRLQCEPTTISLERP